SSDVCSSDLAPPPAPAAAPPETPRAWWAAAGGGSATTAAAGRQGQPAPQARQGSGGRKRSSPQRPPADQRGNRGQRFFHRRVGAMQQVMPAGTAGGAFHRAHVATPRLKVARSEERRVGE